MSRFQVSLQSTCQCLHSVSSFEKFHNINKFDEKIASVEKGVRLKESKENVYEQKPKLKKIKTSWRVEEWQRMVPIDILFLPTVLWTARKKYVLVRKLAPILKQHLSEYFCFTNCRQVMGPVPRTHWSVTYTIILTWKDRMWLLQRGFCSKSSWQENFFSMGWECGALFDHLSIRFAAHRSAGKSRKKRKILGLFLQIPPPKEV